MATCSCGNTARYIAANGELMCGLCPIKLGIDSIKISQVPVLLAAVRAAVREAVPARFSEWSFLTALAEAIA